MDLIGYEEIIKAALANNKTLEPDQFDKTYINLAKSKDTVRAGHSNTNFRWQYEMSLQIDPKFGEFILHQNSPFILFVCLIC